MEPVETFVFLPYNRYKALDSRAKKEQTELPVSNSGWGLSSEEISSEPIPSQSDELIEVKKPIGKDLTKSYRGVQMKKLLQHIEKTEGSSEIVNLPNLEELIKSALSKSKKEIAKWRDVLYLYLWPRNVKICKEPLKNWSLLQVRTLVQCMSAGAEGYKEICLPSRVDHFYFDFHYENYSVR